jgi:hypothetical protein
MKTFEASAPIATENTAQSRVSELFRSAKEKVGDIVSNPNLRQKVREMAVGVGRDALVGAGIVEIGVEGARLSAEGLPAAFSDPSSAFRQGITAAGESAKHQLRTTGIEAASAAVSAAFGEQPDQGPAPEAEAAQPPQPDGAEIIQMR